MAAALLAGAVTWKVYPLAAVEDGRSLSVGVLVDGTTEDPLGSVRAAWTSVLEEEGLVHEWVPAADLTLLSGAEAARRWAAMILPDLLARQLPPSVADRLVEYADAGGSVLVVHDAGTRDATGSYARKGLFTDLLGVDYLRYDRLGGDAYRQGRVRFVNAEAARTWHVPPGKLTDDVVGGYSYGDLAYPIASARVVADEVRVWASDGDVPVLATRRVGRAHVVWANLPLGYLKSHGDDLPMRLVIQAFAVDRAGLPHLLATPKGVGGLVIDWHVDSAVELENLPRMLSQGLIRQELEYQFDVTAGPDRDQPGDGLGLDACGRGRALVRSLMPYGEIGSHGGWMHNYFAQGIRDRTLTRSQVAGLVRRNNQCLEDVTGRPVRGFAAPQGVQPTYLTKILADEGIRAYYYTGDTGSPPTRTFSAGRRVSGTSWAFPVMPKGSFASIGEMQRAGASPDEVRQWLTATLDYVVADRSVRLVYSHPYDLSDPLFLASFSEWTSDVVRRQEAGAVVVGSMPRFQRFAARLVRTTARFDDLGDRLVIRLSNPGGLEDVAVELPPGWSVPDTSRLRVREDPGSARTTVVIEAELRSLSIVARRA